MRIVRTFAALAGLAIIGFTTFKIYSFSAEAGARNPDEATSLAQCNSNSFDELVTYLSQAGILLNQVGDASSFTEEEAMQFYQGLWVLNNELEYPACAESLHAAYSKAFAYEAKAYAALAQGGLIARFMYVHYHIVSTNNIAIIPFITRMIMPPPSIPKGWRMNA